MYLTPPDPTPAPGAARLGTAAIEALLADLPPATSAGLRSVLLSLDRHQLPIEQERAAVLARLAKLRT